MTRNRSSYVGSPDRYYNSIKVEHNTSPCRTLFDSKKLELRVKIVDDVGIRELGSSTIKNLEYQNCSETMKRLVKAIVNFFTFSYQASKPPPLPRLRTRMLCR